MSRSSRRAPRPVVGLIAALGALILVATLTGAVGSPASAAMRPATYERGVAAKVNAVRTAHELRPGVRAACHERAAERAARRLARTGRLPARVGSACPAPVRRVVGVQARTPRAAARVALRKPAVRRAVLADGTRTVSVGTRRKRDGVWVTVILLGGRRTSASTSPSSAPSPAPSPALDPASAAGTMRSAIHTAVDGARTSAGLHALTAHACLQANAQRWAETLASRGSLSHQDLPTIWDECGSSPRLGENVAYRSTADGAAMVAQWMASPGHRANILNSGFTRTGVGVAQGADGRWYGVQVFSGNFF